MIDARIDTAIAILRSLESRQYKIGQARWQAVRDANEVLAAQYKNTPWGVMGLTTKFLIHPEATYLVVNLCEGHYGSSQRGRVSLTRVGFTYIDDEPYAIDLDTAEVLGEMNEIATTAYDRWKPDYSYTSPMKDAAYHGFVFGSPSPRSSLTFDKWVLPLTGPALQHAAFQRQAEFATDILLGKVPAIETLLALDTVNAEINQEDDRQEAIVRAVIDEAVAQYVPAEWDAELVRLMETMDWTFDYADRPNSACYDQRDQIERRLKALPLEVAIAFLHVPAHMWQYAYRLLRNHPEALKAAA